MVVAVRVNYRSKKQVPPICKKKAYRMPLTKRATVDKLIADMLADDIASYANPILLVPKKDCETRFSIDYLKLGILVTLGPAINIDLISDGLKWSITLSPIDPANYRPISLTCILCKVMEHIILSNMWKHLHKHNIILHFQHGFQPGLSYESKLIETVHDWITAMDNKTQIDAIL
ncbi:MAG: hypothetical protein M3H12_07825, partial [Chromatiales bacterium]